MFQLHLTSHQYDLALHGINLGLIASILTAELNPADTVGGYPYSLIFYRLCSEIEKINID